MENRTFQEEQNDLLDLMIKEKFFSPESIGHLELNITATCNLACEYCYLTKYGTEIYPVELRNEETIIENTKLLMKHYASNHYKVDVISLFAGEIWGTAFCNRVFEAVYEGYMDGFFFKQIMIPSNMSFLLNETYKKNIEQWIAKFSRVGVRVTFSASLDGLVVEDMERPFKDKTLMGKRDQKFYDMAFEWCRRYGFFFHPMVSANSIEKWKENYSWYIDMLLKYDYNPLVSAMFLEVRNDEWTEDKIRTYLEFLDFMIDHDFEKLFMEDKGALLKAIFNTTDYRGYRGYTINEASKHLDCTIDKDLMIRMGDLAIGPCHRLHYSQYIYGNYEIENGEIVGVHANNVQLANMFWFGDSTCFDGCNKCAISGHCLKQCFGAQHEANREIMKPCKTVCEWAKAKHLFMCEKLKSLHIDENLLPEGFKYDYKDFLLQGKRLAEEEDIDLCKYLTPRLQEKLCLKK